MRTFKDEVHLSTREVSDRLNLPIQTVRFLVRAKTLPVHRMGKGPFWIPVSAVEALEKDQEKLKRFRSNPPERRTGNDPFY